MFVNTLQNSIINGGFNYWQRNSGSLTSVANATYTADRWRYKKTGDMVQNIAQSSDVPNSAGLSKAIKLTTTNGSSNGLGSELAVNSGFDATVNSWTATGGTISWSSGSAALASASTSAEIYQEVSGLTVGATYILQAKITKSETARPAGVRVYTTAGATLLFSSSFTSTTTYETFVVFTATATTHRIVAYYDRNGTTATASIDYISLKLSGTSKATDLCLIEQLIEGTIATKHYGKKSALSFWVRSSKAGIYCVRLANSAEDRSLIKEYTINAANTWEKKTIHIDHTYSGTWLKDTGVGLRMSFILACGSNYQGVADSWLTGLYYSSANQTNLLDTSTSTFELAEVCLVEDNLDQKRVPNYVPAGGTLVRDLDLCRRYYEKSYSIDVVPATSTIIGMMWVQSASTSNKHFYMAYSVEKRISPLISTWDRAGNASKLTNVANISYTDNITNSPGVALPSNMAGTKGLSWVVAPQTTPTDGTGFHWAADAELS